MKNPNTNSDALTGQPDGKTLCTICKDCLEFFLEAPGASRDDVPDLSAHKSDAPDPANDYISIFLNPSHSVLR
jgi:hypothetical protein